MCARVCACVLATVNSRRWCKSRGGCHRAWRWACSCGTTTTRYDRLHAVPAWWFNSLPFVGDVVVIHAHVVVIHARRFVASSRP